jgi:hypothetical protein
MLGICRCMTPEVIRNRDNQKQKRIMRPSLKANRPRNKNNRKNNNGNSNHNNLNRVYDSNGPEGKVRGTPQQLVEKYVALARDAQMASNIVLSENYLQHAEHYIRIVNAVNANNQARQPQTEHNAARQENDIRRDDDSSEDITLEDAQEMDSSGKGLETFDSSNNENLSSDFKSDFGVVDESQDTPHMDESVGSSALQGNPDKDTPDNDTPEKDTEVKKEKRPRARRKTVPKAEISEDTKELDTLTTGKE